MFDRGEMITELKARVCTVTFNKVNGEERVMKCTLSSDILPIAEAERSINPQRNVREETLSVWDVNKEGWRSFRIANVTAFA